jgi:hypothetical protein
MTNFLPVWLVLGVLSGALQAAETTLLTPLAFTTTPACPARPGVRTLQSGLVEFGNVTASLSAQSSREKEECAQSAALWVTQKGVSQQYDLSEAAPRTFEILDVAPDASAILLSSSVPLPGGGNDYYPQVTAVSLTDGAFKWTPVSELLGLKNCNASFKPQGFLDAKHIEIAVEPKASSNHVGDCTDGLEFYSVDLEIPRVKPIASSGVNRAAKAVSGPVRSCKTDPDVVGACYTTRARLAMNGPGQDLLLWQLSGAHYMSVEEEMMPSSLREQLSPEVRVLATMILCPMLVQRRGPKPYVCIESATGLRAEPIPHKNTPAAGKPVATASNHP